MSHYPQKRDIFVNKIFQLKFCVYLIIPVIASLCAFWISVEYFFFKMLEVGRQSSLQPDHPFYTFISVQKQDLSKIVVLAAVALSVIMFTWGIFISRQIAGPIFKLEKYLDKTETLEDVKKDPLKFRKNDFFQEIPTAFNQFVSRVSKNEKT